MKKKKNIFLFLAYFVFFFLLRQSSAYNDLSLLNPDCDDDLVQIDEDNQELYVNKTGETCIRSIHEARLNQDSSESQICPITWDTIMCWPETPVNQTVFQQCPDYVNNFNKKNQASKTCYIDENGHPTWSKTFYEQCSPKACEKKCSMEVHLRYVMIIRICGYIVSMVTLIVSIMILLRPKLRCPRNYVHINLFLAFIFRTILVGLVDSILKNTATLNRNEDRHIPCKIMMIIFRYSGSVYHVAIFSEAIYLVMLLKFPYYNEMKGCRFCIIASWVLPFIWMIPWILVRSFFDDEWCWNTESDFNLILKLPYTLLLIGNIVCAVFIIRILYSKMQNRNLSREKIMKYRRLAKSILIIIPIFGLHFIIFAWYPYTKLIKLTLTDCTEVIFIYFETFFNAIQGLVVSIACCFMHREVRIEFILVFCNLIRKIKCLKSFKCMNNFNSDYVRQLRYTYYDNRRPSNNVLTSEMDNLNENKRISNVTNSKMNIFTNEDDSPILFKKTSRMSSKDVQMINSKKRNLSHMSFLSSSTNASNSNMSTREKSCFKFLFGDKKNDFFVDSRESRSRSFRNKKNSSGYLFTLSLNKNRNSTQSSASMDRDEFKSKRNIYFKDEIIELDENNTQSECANQDNLDQFNQNVHLSDEKIESKFLNETKIDDSFSKESQNNTTISLASDKRESFNSSLLSSDLSSLQTTTQSACLHHHDDKTNNQKSDDIVSTAIQSQQQQPQLTNVSQLMNLNEKQIIKKV